MSESLTNLLGRRVVVDGERVPFHLEGTLGMRVGQSGEVVVVEDDDGDDFILGVLWPDGKVLKYSSTYLTIEDRIREPEETSLPKDSERVERFNGFVQHSRTWYRNPLALDAQNCFDEVHVIIGRLPEGGCRYEFSLKWYALGGGHPPQLQIFDDAWDVFAEIPELFQMLSEHSTTWPERRGSSSMTPDEFCEELKSLGFIDVTEEVQGEGPVGLKS